MMRQIRIADELGHLLTGKFRGQQEYAKLLGLLAGINPGEVALLDFNNVEYVSGSWINWALIPLLNFASDEANDFYVLFASFPAVSIDDLEYVAKQNYAPVVVLPSSENASCGEVVGPLDVIQRRTLEAVQSHGPTTGAELGRKMEGDASGPAWNNRLRDLHKKRLVRRQRLGREQVYSPLVTEVHFHG